MQPEIKLTRDMKRTALDLFRMDSGGDPWGEGVSHCIGICEVLYHADQDVPDIWEFRHGASSLCNPIEAFLVHASHDPDEDDADCYGCSGMWPDIEYVPFLDAGPLGVAMLTYAGNVLSRYLGFVKRAGRDY